MTIEASPGPRISWGQNAPVANGAAPADYNADTAPDLSWGGLGLLDPRYGFKNGGGSPVPGTSAPLAIGFAPGVNYMVIDAVPSAVSTSNIALAQNVTSGVPLVLTAGTGITTIGATKIPQTGMTVPAGVLAIDGIPYLIKFGVSGAVAIADPTRAVSRAVSISGVAGGTGGSFEVISIDLYGRYQTETIVVGAGAVTANGKKGCKFIASVIPSFTDAHDYSVGTTDIYELPLRADSYGYVGATWDNVPVTNPSFVAADTTVPPTMTTGSVRGTITLPSASDGIKRLQIQMGVSLANLSSIAGLFGLTPG